MNCPKCKSDKLSGDTKGFGAGKAAGGAFLIGPLGLLAGLFGRNKTMVQCLSCGKRWSPEKLKRQRRGTKILAFLASIAFPPLLIITVPWWLLSRRKAV